MTKVIVCLYYSDIIKLKYGREVELAILEYNLLEIFVINKNMALSMEKVLEFVWGYDFTGDNRTVDIHIMKLHKKLDFDDILFMLI